MRGTKRLLSAIFAVLLLFLCACSGDNMPDLPDIPDSSGVSVIYMGDPQSDPETPYDYSGWGALLVAAAETAPDASALVLGGDIVNESGDEDEWSAFLAAGGDLLSSLTVYTAAGNHDDREILRERFGLPGGETPGDGLFYSFDIGDIHFSILDSSVMGTLDGETAAAVSAWLEEDLSSCASRWKIAVMHHPMCSVNGNYKDEQRAGTMRANYLPILEKHGVSAVLCGHQHISSRTAPLSQGGPIQIMGVSGGKQYDPTDGAAFDFVCTDGPVFTVISAQNDALSFNTYDASGSLLDSVSIN